MGCIQSTSSRPHSPQHHEPREQAVQTPLHHGYDDRGIGIIKRNLERVLEDTDRLVSLIERDRQTIGGSLEPVLRSARNLSERIGRKINGNVARGSGADTYRTSLESIRRDYSAIITANAEVDDPEMFPDYSTVFEIQHESSSR